MAKIQMIRKGMLLLIGILSLTTAKAQQNHNLEVGKNLEIFNTL